MALMDRIRTFVVSMLTYEAERRQSKAAELGVDGHTNHVKDILRSEFTTRQDREPAIKMKIPPLTKSTPKIKKATRHRAKVHAYLRSLELEPLPENTHEGVT